ncbi:MAG: aldose 1-epimerase family protein [Nannocystaceae bacterium]
MKVFIENDRLRVEVATRGGELVSFFDRRRQRQLLWQGDPEFWGRRAPVLFPIVGRLAGDEARYPSVAAPMGQHGFARDLTWTELDRTAGSLLFRLQANADTRAVYPHDFELETRYSLEGCLLRVEYRVRNHGGDAMPFSIGAHPGFRCPWGPGEDFDDYFLEFEAAERADRIVLVAGLRDGERRPGLLGQRVLPLSRRLFEDDALAFDQLVSRHVTLCSRRSAGGLRMHFEGFPFFAIWTKPRSSAPFVCLEPWHGIADASGPVVPFAEKLGMRSLEAGGEFACAYRLEVT